MIEVELREHRDWEQRVLLQSDDHWDSKKCLRDLLAKHCAEAVEYDAPILKAGDLFDFMGGKYDKRSHKGGLRPEHLRDDYFEFVPEDAADWHAPYAKQIAVVGKGNHETEVEKRHEINPIERFTTILNSKHGARALSCGFSGWVIFSFSAARGGPSYRVVYYFDHGFGGGAPVTDDMISMYRRAVLFPDADIVASGHTHGAWTREVARVRLNRDGSLRQEVQTHIKLGSYKDDYGRGEGGWAVEKGIPPKPPGGWWLRFFWCRTKRRVLYEVFRAQ